MDHSWEDYLFPKMSSPPLLAMARAHTPHLCRPEAKHLPGVTGNTPQASMKATNVYDDWSFHLSPGSMLAGAAVKKQLACNQVTLFKTATRSRDHKNKYNLAQDYPNLQAALRVSNRHSRLV
jgi:hypothetical protein